MSFLSPSLPAQQPKRKSITPPSLLPTNHRRNELKEMAVNALQSMNSRQLEPKDSSTAFGEYIAAELRSLTPEQATYARSKLRRAFNDIMDEAALMVPHQQHQENRDVLFTPIQTIQPNQGNE
ncbi:uncharacterized protein LOC124419677 [Lucilia cuprina]|uniref:uncharacterized protein LOC124419677 n=1 Tax=Lucilia cuprina TaxID=7375 RepID=UPI001F050CC2|nr:uncharacterized protein LOC124419677 [Lucilia cuprina]